MPDAGLAVGVASPYALQRPICAGFSYNSALAPHLLVNLIKRNSLYLF